MLILVAIVGFTLGWGLCMHLAAQALRASDTFVDLLTRFGHRDRVAILHSRRTPTGFELYWVHLDAAPIAEAMRGQELLTFRVETQTASPGIYVTFVKEP